MLDGTQHREVARVVCDWREWYARVSGSRCFLVEGGIAPYIGQLQSFRGCVRVAKGWGRSAGENISGGIMSNSVICSSCCRGYPGRHLCSNVSPIGFLGAIHCLLDQKPSSDDCERCLKCSDRELSS